MTILDTAIKREHGVTKLAAALGVRQSVVSNWRVRGLPKPWRMVLELRYSDAQLNSPTTGAHTSTASQAQATAGQEMANA
jgi:hypothetical protein